MPYNHRMQDYRKLKVWLAARDLAVDLYRLTSTFPPSERFGITQQIRRAAISVSSNIAEGCGRDSQRELLRFLRIASGSAHEVESQLILATDLGMCERAAVAPVRRNITEIKSMLAGLQAAVRAPID